MGSLRIGFGRLLGIGIPLALGGVLLFALRGTKPQPQRAGPEVVATPVRVVPLSKVQVLPRILGYGTAVPVRTYLAVARVEGEVVWIADHLEDGGLAAKDDVLLRIDDTDLILERARIDAAISAIDAQVATLRASLVIEEADLALTEVDVARQRSLVEQEIEPQTALDQAERQLLMSRAKVQALHNQITLADAERAVVQVQRSQAERSLQHVEIAAPFDMRIGEVNIEVGQFVTRGQAMFAGDGTAAVEIPALFPIGRLRPLVTGAVRGQARGPLALDAIVRLRTPARVIEWAATVDRVSSIVDPGTQSGMIVVRVDGSYEMAVPGERPPIRRNTFLEVELRAPPRGALVLPAEAIHDGKIWVVDSEGCLSIREIRIAYRIGSAVVLEAGAREGELVVVSDLPVPTPGMLVGPIEDEKLVRRLIAEATGRERAK